jgi:hypothetical protein
MHPVYMGGNYYFISNHEYRYEISPGKGATLKKMVMFLLVVI